MKIFIVLALILIMAGCMQIEYAVESDGAMHHARYWRTGKMEVEQLRIVKGDLEIELGKSKGGSSLLQTLERLVLILERLESRLP